TATTPSTPAVPTAPRTTAPATTRKPVRLRSRAPHSVARPRRSVLMTVLAGTVLLYALVPLFWLLVNASKTQSSLFSSFGLWFRGDFALFDNVVRTLTYDDGIFGRW